MTVMGIHAWVTSAVEDKCVEKALVLAGSLRRVCTAKKLVVLTSVSVSEKLRNKLKKAFDLVALLEQKSPNGLSLEDQAKVEGFSLVLFSKCVYLSPNTLVLKNCDDIFEKYGNFAAWGNDADGVDSSVYVFTPSLDFGQALQKIKESSKSKVNGSNPLEKKTGCFGKYFQKWIRNNVPDWERLDEEYNVSLKLNGGSNKRLGTEIRIANFGNSHPLDWDTDENLIAPGGLGVVEKFAVELFENIYNENVKSKRRVRFELSHQNEIFKTEPIAIVGMSFRLPGGNNVDEFWELLINGRDAIRPIPNFRWSREHTIQPCQNHKVEAGFLSVPVDEFDAKFFGISGKEAEFLDPQQRLLHEVAWEALEDAMIDPLSLRGTKTGMFVGSWIHDYKDMVSRITDPDFFRTYMGNSIGAGAARLSHFFETTGPSIGTESGCSSAMVAVDMAVKSLRSHDSNLAMACGVNLILHPFDQRFLGFVLAPDNRCKTFDADANGFGRAEGCAVLLMKRYSDAVRDQDKIWGLIRGSAVTQEGVSKSLGTPTVHCESLAMELALADADVNPNDITFVETHGTGTPVGDPMEVAAITNAYSKGRLEPLVIGSVKTNVGHTESVSGITGIIKVLLSMKHERIPPHLNFKRLNPAIDLEEIPAIIPLVAMDWPKKNDKPRIAGVSSFGISGTDSHAIIQEPPAQKIFSSIIPGNVEQDRPLHILKLSAKCPESLEELLSTYENILSSKEDSDEGFADLAYSANMGRATLNHRAVIIANNFKEAQKIIKDKSFKQAEVQSGAGRLCLLFTGQGSQYHNMAMSLYETSPIFRDHFDKCDEILSTRYGINLQNVIRENSDGGHELCRTLYSQTSIFCIEYCLLKLWESWGVKPDYVIGHSLGEFAAAVAAGALDFEDALMLVAERSRLIDGLSDGMMLVIKADKKTVAQNIEKFKQLKPNFWVDYAAINSSDQTVVAGDIVMIQEFAKFCGENSLKTIILAATHAFHSRHMEPMMEEYRKIAERVKHPEVDQNTPKYISGMEGKLSDLEQIDSDYWVRHTREPVNFIDACKTVHSEGCSLFLEIGPHPVLSALTMMNLEGQSVTCLPSIRRKEDEWVTMLDSLAKLYLSDWKGQIDWKGFDRYYKRSRVSLPFYPFNRKPIWKELELVPPTIHPLLGKVFPVAGEHTMFENRLTSKNTPFVQDHVIGNTVVFPGAGFLEMCLAGGHATVQGTFVSVDLKKPQRPVLLSSLKIASPLGLTDSGVCHLQTTVKLDKENTDELCYSVGVHRFVRSTAGGVGEWIPHATANYLPFPENLTKEQLSSIQIDIPSIESSWEAADVKSFYEQLPEVGLRFGPKFRSLQTGWKSESGILFPVKLPDDNDRGYLIHPIVADAMIQAVMLWTSKDKPKIKLQVPVQIGEFGWLQAASSSGRYIYCSTNEEGKTNCILLDDQGTHLALMNGVDFIETSVKLVEGMLQQQTTVMPKLWREVWKNTPGALQSAHNLRAIQQVPFTAEHKKRLADINDVPDYELRFHDNLCNMARLFLLNALYELGWEPKQGQQFTLADLINLLPNPKEHFVRYIHFYLRAIVDIGMIKVEVQPGSEDTYSFMVPPPTQDEIEEALNRVITPDDTSRIEYKMVVKNGRNLSKLWLGTVDSLQLLFPDDPSKPNADQFYAETSQWVFPVFEGAYEGFSAPIFEESNRHHGKGASSSPPILRVLEVGAGTGGLTKRFLESCLTSGTPLEFHFTDISASFFTPAEKRFENYSKQMVFKKLNMEEDPLAQGFCPNYFDIIIAEEVLHVAKDIRKTLRNLACLLKPGGIFQFLETIQPDLKITQIFGVLEGYWQFEDTDFRPYHITLTPEKWEEALKEANFDKVFCTPAYNNCHGCITARLSTKEDNQGAYHGALEKPRHSWLLFYQDSTTELMERLTAKLVGVNRSIYTVKRPSVCTEEDIKRMMKSYLQSPKEGEELEGIIYLWGCSDDVDNRDQSLVSLPLVNLVQEMAECKNPPRLYVVTHGTAFVEGSEVINPNAATLHGILKAYSNENTTLQLSCLDLSPHDRDANQVEEIFCELWATHKGNRGVAFRDGVRFSSKLCKATVNNNEPLPLPSGCDRFQLVLPKSKLISDLEFGVLENSSLGENDVEVKVKAMALNFKDLLAILKPIPELDDFNCVGLDIAGEVVKVGSKVTKRKVGDRVIAMNIYRDVALPSHIKMDEEHVVEIPPQMTYAEGVTLPAVFITVYYCLFKNAKMKRGDSLLIHTATGGVGLCAIQMARLMGAEIIATAGSKRKKNYLRNLGIKHVFHSRNTQFGQQILEVTNGRGVDIVLNSLTGEGFKEASMSALAKNGRFIEMSKLNVWKPEEVKEMRPDVFYKIADFDVVERSEMQELVDHLKEFLAGNNIRPIPYERFDAVNIRGALNYLQKAKHIGKIVCMMPEVKVENSKIIATTPLFNDLSTYLVTGGLGGIGFEVVKWMLKSGAKHIAIVSRSPPKPEIVSQIDSWNKSGKHVEAFSMDIGNYEECSQLFQELGNPSRGFPQLRGVMHAAGVLADSVLENQTWSKFNYTYNPKVNGTWNLHDLTKDMLLEHFVVFSSMASAIGSPGQTNHAASNSFEDSLCAYRLSNGLPALPINWGNWGEVGVATETDFPGFRPIATSQGLLALETFLKTQTSHVCVLNVDSFAMAVKLFPNLKNYVDDKRLFGLYKPNVIINSDEFWRGVDAADDRQGKLPLFKDCIKSTLKNILKMDQEEVINDHTDFQALGVDSLMMLEMRNGLQNILGSRMTLTASQLKDCSNTESLADRLVEILQGHEDQIVFPTMEELKQLVREDSALPEHIRPSEEMPLSEVSQIETVLLTGATGILGPYLLRDLSHRPMVKKIICFVRKSGKLSPSERLFNRLQAIGLADHVDLTKVECIEADITEYHFGLSGEAYNNLSNQVDAIVNSAVITDHTARYYRAPERKKLDVRNVNVKGVIGLLAFAVHSKLKHVYHASSLGILTTTDEDGCIVEGWQDVGAFDAFSINAGYPLSKHISEQLCEQAIQRGIPCKTFRHPLVGGDSKTGRCDYLTNHFMLRRLAYLKLRCMPDMPAPMMMMAADHCARISLDIFLNPQAPPDVYNISQREGAIDHVIIGIAEEFGIPIEPVSFSEFVEKLKQEKDDSPLAPFKHIYENQEDEIIQNFEASHTVFKSLQKYVEDSSNFFRSRKLPQLIPYYDELETWSRRRW